MVMAPKKKEGKTKTKKKGKAEPSPEERERLDLLQKASDCVVEANSEKELEEQFIEQTQHLKQYWEIEKNIKSVSMILIHNLETRAIVTSHLPLSLREQDKKQSLLQKGYRLNELKDGHAIKLSKYKQTIKDQLFENQDELARKATESLVSIHSTTARHHHEAGLQEDDLHEISKRIDSTVRSNKELKNAMRQWRNDLTTDLRQQAARRIASLAVYSEKQFKSTREQYDRQLKEELKDLERSHDDRISSVMEQNKQQFHQMRKSCNITINNNLDRIIRLRNEANELRDHDRYTRKTLHEMHNQNTNIVVPLESNKKSLTQLNLDLELCINQRQQLQIQKKQLKTAEDKLKEIEWDHEVLYQKLEGLQKDHSSQKKAFNDSIYAAQQQSNYQNLLLEQRIQKLSKSGTKNCAAIVGILKKANIGIDALVNSNAPITDVVKDKNDFVQFLQDELKSVTDAHSRLLERYEAIKASKVP